VQPCHAVAMCVTRVVWDGVRMEGTCSSLEAADDMVRVHTMLGDGMCALDEDYRTL
jgi:hypothetical protein